MNPGLIQNFGIDHIAVDHHRMVERIRHSMGAFPVPFDDARGHAGIVLFYDCPEKCPDIAAASDNDPPRLPLLMAERRHAPIDVIGIDNEIDVVAWQHVIVRGRNKSLPVTHHCHDHDIEVGKQARELPQGVLIRGQSS